MNEVDIDTAIGLIHVSDDQPGYTRRRCGRGFSYLDETGQLIRDKILRKRIENLVIPPIWQNVWICKMEQGHLQATGYDLKQRKQYIYHPKWISYRQKRKFLKMVEFAHVLPSIRKTTRKHLRKRKWDKDKVLALIVQVLDEAYIRIGNSYYKENNQTFGLTTLRRKHFEFEENEIHFEYKGKSNQYREVSISDSRLARLIKECSELPGYEVFRYLDEQGKSQPVDSSEVNAYIQNIAGDKFSSKDFRTWAGTTLAVAYFEEAKKEVEENTKKDLAPTLVKKVAAQLGNTPSVCREYYIHPAVLKAGEIGSIVPLDNITEEQLAEFDNELDREEVLAYHLIKDY